MQPSYGLKPAPTLDPERTPEQHLNGLKAHFDKSVRRYGSHVRITPPWPDPSTEWRLEDGRQFGRTAWQGRKPDGSVPREDARAAFEGSEVRSVLPRKLYAMPSPVDERFRRYHEFDFHAECKGMRYENISRLILQVERTFEHQGYACLVPTLLSVAED